MSDIVNALRELTVKTLFIGFDFSLTCTGVVVLDDGFNLVKHAAWKPPAVVGHEVHRLKWYSDKLEALVTDLRSEFGSEVRLDASVEGYAYTDSDPHLGELGGVMKLLWLRLVEESMTILTPTSVKKFASGKGNLPKSLIVASVQKRWNQDFLSHDKAAEDISDAYAVSRFRVSYVKWEKGEFIPNGYEHEALTGKKESKSTRGKHRKHKDNDVLLPKETRN